jgi:Zn-dependent protease with chaperone function
MPLSIESLLLFAATCGWAALAPLAFGAPLVLAVRRAANQHWTEQARHLTALRRHFAFSTVIPVGACVGVMLVAHRSQPPAAQAGIMVPVLLGFLLGGMLRGRLARRMVPPAIATRPSRVALWFFQVPWVLFFAGVALQTGRPDARFFVILGIFLVAMLLWSLGCHLGLLEWVGALRPGRPALSAACQEAAAAAGLPAPRVWEIADSTANAFALPFRRAVLATTPLLDILNGPQLAAVCRHEMAHLAEPLRVHLPKLLMPLFYAFWMSLPTLLRVAPRGTEPLVFIGGPLAYLLLVRLLTAGSHHRETVADQAAVRSDDDPAVYTSALEAIHRANRIPARLGHGKRTHPDLYDRMLAAGIQPGFSCPAPPPRGWQRVATLLSVAPPMLLLLIYLAEK